MADPEGYRTGLENVQIHPVGENPYARPTLISPSFRRWALLLLKNGSLDKLKLHGWDAYDMLKRKPITSPDEVFWGRFPNDREGIPAFFMYHAGSVAVNAERPWQICSYGGCLLSNHATWEEAGSLCDRLNSAGPLPTNLSRSKFGDELRLIYPEDK